MKVRTLQFVLLLLGLSTFAALGCASTANLGITRCPADHERMAVAYLERRQITHARKRVELANAYGLMTERRLGWWRALLGALSTDGPPAADWQGVVDCLRQQEEARTQEATDARPGPTQALLDLYGRCSPASIRTSAVLHVDSE